MAGRQKTYSVQLTEDEKKLLQQQANARKTITKFGINAEIFIIEGYLESGRKLMIHSIKNLEERSIPVSITQAALKIARFFADEQVTPEKKKQVYFNTFAVCAVNDYMEMMNIPTDPRTSDSWNCAMHYYADVADLKLSGLGHLECRPLANGNLCHIPPEVPDDRIGVVVVKLDIEHQQATLIGFTKTVKAGELLFNELQTIEDLLAYLDSLESNATEVNLSYWLQNIIDVSWQPISEILAIGTAKTSEF